MVGSVARNRFVRVAAASACALALLLGAGSRAAADVAPGKGGGTGIAGAPNPSLAVSNYQFLRDGQAIDVRGTGFCPNNGNASCQPTYGIEECRAPVQGSADCDSTPLSTAGDSRNPGRDDTNGAFTATVIVHTSITLPNGSNFACNATGSCAVGASNFSNSNQLPAAYLAIGFGGAPPTATPTQTPVSVNTPAPTARPSARPTAVPAVPSSASIGPGAQAGIGLGMAAVILGAGTGGYFFMRHLRRRAQRAAP